MLPDESWDVRASVGAPGKIGDSSAVNPILPFLQDNNKIVYRNTMNALEESGASMLSVCIR